MPTIVDGDDKRAAGGVPFQDVASAISQEELGVDAKGGGNGIPCRNHCSPNERSGCSNKRSDSDDLSATPSPQSWVCPNCQNTNTSEHSRCSSCPARHPDTKWICGGCGNVNGISQMRCADCRGWNWVMESNNEIKTQWLRFGPNIFPCLVKEGGGTTCALESSDDEFSTDQCIREGDSRSSESSDDGTTAVKEKELANKPEPLSPPKTATQAPGTAGAPSSHATTQPQKSVHDIQHPQGHSDETSAKIDSFLRGRCDMDDDDVPMKPSSQEIKWPKFDRGKRSSKASWDFDYRVEELRRHFAQHGVGAVILKKHMKPTLQQWVGHQRSLYREKSLSNNRVKCLEGIGFEFTAPRWHITFNRLSEYLSQHNNEIPQKHMPILHWVWQQRKQIRSDALSDEQVKLLTQMIDKARRQGSTEIECEDIFNILRIGDNSAVSKGSEGANAYAGEKLPSTNHKEAHQITALYKHSLWETRFRELAWYSLRTGTCNVSETEDAKLYHWRRNQLRTHRKGTLLPQRYDRLASLGFDFVGAKQKSNQTKAQKHGYAVKGCVEEDGFDYDYAEPEQNEEEELKTEKSGGSQEESDDIPANPSPQSWVCASCKNTNAAFEGRCIFCLSLNPNAKWLCESCGCMNAPRRNKCGVCESWKQGQQPVQEFTAHQMRNGEEGISSKDPAHESPPLATTRKKEQTDLVENNQAPARADDYDNAEDGEKPPSQPFGSFTVTGTNFLEELWESTYNELAEHKEQHGSCKVRHVENPGLYDWARTQLRAYRRGKLSQYRYDRLALLDFDFDEVPLFDRTSWEERYAQLKEHKESCGSCNVSRQENKKLWQWSRQQRSKFQRGELSQDRCDRLELLDFEFTRSRSLTTWEERYDQLAQHKQSCGSCDVAWKENVELTNWISKQRSHFRRGKLSQDRCDRLAMLGFDFQKQELARTTWEDRLNDYIQYKETNQGREPGSKKAPVLGRWCSLQRREFRAGKLKQDRLDSLEQAGFVFETPQTKIQLTCAKRKQREDWNAKWDEHYQELADFYHTHGHTSIKGYNVRQELREWMRSIRDRHKRNKLSSDRLEKLKLLNFFAYEEPALDGKKRKCTGDVWSMRFGEMVQHYEEHGTCRVLKSHGNRSLLKWREHQIYNHKRKIRLSATQTEKLQQIDFWNTSMDEKPRCENDDCQKFASFGEYCHFHSNTSGHPCMYACCQGLGDAEEGDDEQVNIGQNENHDENDTFEEVVMEDDVQFHAMNDDFGDDDDASHTDEQMNSSRQASTWESQYHVLTAYIDEHGHPPQNREDNPQLYDWLQIQKERQRMMERMF